MVRRLWSVVLAAIAAAALATPAEAKTFRWANDSDVNSLDPYARQEIFSLSFVSNIYEPLIRRDGNLRLEPSLAIEWGQLSPHVWRFKLRPGVRFHDGTPFTADDVVFSFARVTGPGSNLSRSVAGVKEARRIDEDTVDLVTEAPDPILPEEITAWDMMSKAWCEKNDAERTADPAKGEENYATAHANGTGPFMLKEREVDTRTVMVRNPDWWDRPVHNLDEVVFRRIAESKPRVAQLLSGDLDMIYSVPSEDVDLDARSPEVRIIEGPELRTIFLGFDVARTELLESNVKGKNPFRDIRVRRAFYQAIDEEAIKNKVMRGFARPTGLMVGSGVTGFDAALDQRLLPYDPAAAKKLLAEAGYPRGFELGMDCPNDRYINDQEICQAVVAMLARIGVKVKAKIRDRAEFFAKILAPGYKTSFFLLGWAPATLDAENMLVNVLATRDGQGRGDYNAGGYSNPKLDELIDRVALEGDEEKRLSLLHDALRLVKEDVATIPLHQQVLVWAARKNVELVQPADNYLPLRYVRMN
jgi:peptide/nickel transport system substrate-binding protein